MFKCYSIGEELTEGIPSAQFDCLLTQPNEALVKYADIQLVPVLPYIQPSLLETAQLSLSFIRPYDKPSGYFMPGCIVSVDSSLWSVCDCNSGFVLLDPGGVDWHVLLFLPADASNVLIRMGTNDVVSTAADGMPFISKQSTGNLMLSAIMPDMLTDPEKDAAIDTAPPRRSARRAKKRRPEDKAANAHKRP